MIEIRAGIDFELQSVSICLRTPTPYAFLEQFEPGLEGINGFTWGFMVLIVFMVHICLNLRLI